jgi:hypothetical protein
MLTEWQLMEITVSTAYNRKMMMTYMNSHIIFITSVMWINKDVFPDGTR